MPGPGLTAGPFFVLSLSCRPHAEYGKICFRNAGGNAASLPAAFVPRPSGLRGCVAAQNDRLIGELWAGLSEGRCRFVMIKDKRWDWSEPLLP